MRKILISMLLLLLLCCTAAAYEVPEDFTGMTLEEAVAEFMQEYQLTENNFSISYFNTVTGESYDFNETKFAIAASTYKLPLNMYFYEMERTGEIDPDETFLWTGMTLSEVHEQSVLYSNNEVSEAMAGYWNNYYIYKENMRKYSSIPVDEIPESYYLTNHSCTRMMMDTLKYLYANSENFEELLGYMKEAMPGQYFKAGVQEYEIAHKYGAVDIFVNDVGIIYTPQPILLAVYTQGIYGDGVCAQAARLMTNYVVWQTGDHSQEVSGDDVPLEIPEDETSMDLPIVEPVKKPEVAQPEISEPERPEVSEPEQQPQPETEKPAAVKEREARKAQQAQQKKKKTTWTIIGIGSALMIVAIPVVLRKRY